MLKLVLTVVTIEDNFSLEIKINSFVLTINPKLCKLFQCVNESQKHLCHLLTISQQFYTNRLISTNIIEMDKQFCEMLFNSTSLLSEDPVKQNNETFFNNFNYGTQDDELYLNFYHQFFLDENNVTRDTSSDWESEESGDDFEEEIVKIDEIVSIRNQITVEDSVETKKLLNFCQQLSHLLPNVSDLDQNDPLVAEEIEATENESVHMDLLTCSAATANCYRDPSSRVSIKSKYGKWSCSGKSNPDLGLGPLSHLFRDNCLPNKTPQNQDIIEIQTTVCQNQSIADDYNKIGDQFNSRETNEELMENYSLFYNQQNQFNPYFELQNQIHINESNCFEKSLTQEMGSHFQTSNQIFNSNPIYNNDYNYEQNSIQNFYYQ